jgi:hypothetical protein
MGISRNDAYPSKYIKTADFTGPATYTLHSLNIEEVGQEKERRPIAYFKEINRGMVINRTNWDVLEDTFGPDTDRWIGQVVEVFPTTTSFGGRRVPCLRIRLPKAPIGQDLNDAIPGFDD